jgi:hypothetical protein
MVNRISKFFIKAGLLLLGILVLLVTAALLIYQLPLKEPEIAPEISNLFISNVHIIDVENQQVRLNQSVLIRDGQIQKISATLKPTDFSDYKFIDGSDKYLMPGLWDMHTHSLKLSPFIHHPLFIRFGVTSVRDMSGCLNRNDPYWACPADRREWSQKAITAEAVSPVYHLESSYQTNGGNEVPSGFPDYFRLRNERNAVQMLDFYKAQGVDFIKTYTELSGEQFKWLAQASAAIDIRIAGHKPFKVSLEDAMANNMASTEHGRLFAFECYENISEFRALPNPLSSYTVEKIRDIISKQDDFKCDRLMSMMAMSSTAWVPTLTTLKMSAEARSQPVENDARLDFIPFVLKKLIWEPDVARSANSGFDNNGKYVHFDYYSLVKRQIKKSHEHGVRILVGTDNIDTMVFSGLSVHEEISRWSGMQLQWLNQSGLT